MLAIHFVPVKSLDEASIVSTAPGRSWHELELPDLARQFDLSGVGGPWAGRASSTILEKVEDAGSHLVCEWGEVVIEAGCLDVPVNNEDFATPLSEDGGDISDGETPPYTTLIRVKRDD